MTKTVDFIFDFASPNAYLVWSVLPDLADRASANVNVIPCLLGGIFKATGNQGPTTAFATIKGKMSYEMLETRRFISKHDLIRFTMNPHFPVNSLLAMRGLVAAEREGERDTYLAAVLRGFWEEGLKMDDQTVFRSVLHRAGLDGDAIVRRTQDADVKQKLADNTAAAVERGVFGIPTFFVDDEMFFGKERLQQVVEALNGAIGSAPSFASGASDTLV